MGNTPNERDNKKSKGAMKEGVDRVIDDKKDDGIGTDQAERKVARDLKDAADRDAHKK